MLILITRQISSANKKKQNSLCHPLLVRKVQVPTFVLTLLAIVSDAHLWLATASVVVPLHVCCGVLWVPLLIRIQNTKPLVSTNVKHSTAHFLHTLHIYLFQEVRKVIVIAQFIVFEAL